MFLTIGLVLGCLVAVYVFVLRPVYNIYFHPLSAFPGPRTWAASSIPFTRSCLSGSAPFDILKLHDIYGDVVRIRPNELSFIHHRASKDLKRHQKSENIKDPIWFGTPGLKDSLLGASSEIHARFRRMLAPAFSSKAVSLQETLIQLYVDQLISGLQRSRGSDQAGKVNEVNLGDWFSYFTFDIIGDLAFGEPFDCMKSADYHPWVAGTIRSMEALMYMGLSRQYLPSLDTLIPKVMPKRLAAAMRNHGKLASEKVAKRLASSSARLDFIGVMSNNGREKDSVDQMTPEEIRANATILLVAGAETTATALAGAVHLLTDHPFVLERLTTEIRTNFSHERDINLVRVGQLKYLTAVIDEVLRIYPPAPWAQPRQVRPEGDVIAGRYVPGSTVVGIWQWAVHHSSGNFASPDVFIPERWLGSETFFENDQREAFQPFSIGPRDCIGRNFAYAEMRLALARLLWNFDITQGSDGRKWLEDSKVYLLWKKPALKMHLVPCSNAEGSEA